MSRTTRLLAGMLNQAVTGAKCQGPDGMELYASISQPPIKVIDKHGTDDEMEWTVECPNCGAHKKYGTQVFMNSGRIYCDAKGCREKLEAELNA